MKQPWLRASLRTDKPVLLIDMDGVLTHFDKRVEELKAKGVTIGKLFRHEDAYVDLEPIEGAIEAWHILQTKFDTYILSTPPWSNPQAWAEKRIWVDKYLGKTANKKLILCHNKGLVLGKYLIDDRKANGVEDFTGELIQFGTEKFPGWKEILIYLEAI